MSDQEPLVISTFANRLDNVPEHHATTWPRLVQSLTQHQRLLDKSAAPLWSPARFRSNAHRGKDNVEAVSLLVFDIDDGSDAETIAYWLAEHSYVIVSSYSHTPAHPKLRVALRLVEAIPAADFDAAWRRANQHLLHGHVDPSTKDGSRIYFVPSCPPDAKPLVVVHDGRSLDWRALPPLPKPKSLPKRKTSAVGAPATDDGRRAAAMLAKWERELADMPANSGRHNRLLELARAAGGLVASGVLNQDDVTDALGAAARTNGLEADDGERAVRKTIADGIDHGKATAWVPDDLPDSPAWQASRRFHRTSRGVVDTDTGEVLDEAWQQERTNGTTPAESRHQVATWPEPLDAAAYYGLAGDIVRAIEPRTESDPVAILVQVLVAFGSAIGRSPHFRVEATRHGTNEFVVLVGDTSKARKGTSQDHVRSLFSRVDDDWAQTRVTSGLSSGEGLINEVRDAIVKTEVVREKGRPIGDYQDVVVDAGVQDKRLLLVEAEFSRVLRVNNRETNTLSQILRDAWDGLDLRTMTRQSGLRATGPHISLVGHITRDEVRRELTTTDAANGLGNRFAWLAVRRSRELPFGGTPDAATLNALLGRLHAAVEHGRAGGEVGMDAEARDLWVTIYHDLSSGKPGLLGSMLARAEAHVRRFAMLYALLDGRALVSADHLQASLALWDYAERSTRWVFGDLLGDPVADTILDTLRRVGELTRTEINDLFGGHRSSQARIGPALASLLAAGLAAFEKRPTGGRAQEVWRVK